MKQNVTSPKKNKQKNKKKHTTTTKFAFVTTNLPTKKIPNADGIIGEFQQTVKKELISILHKQQEHLSTYFMKHHIPNTEK